MTGRKIKKLILMAAFGIILCMTLQVTCLARAGGGGSGSGGGSGGIFSPAGRRSWYTDKPGHTVRFVPRFVLWVLLCGAAAYSAASFIKSNMT